MSMSMRRKKIVISYDQYAYSLRLFKWVSWGFFYDPKCPTYIPVLCIVEVEHSNVGVCYFDVIFCSFLIVLYSTMAADRRSKLFERQSAVHTRNGWESNHLCTNYLSRADFSYIISCKRNTGIKYVLLGWSWCLSNTPMPNDSTHIVNILVVCFHFTHR